MNQSDKQDMEVNEGVNCSFNFNVESYFLAGNRIKFQNEKKPSTVLATMNDSKRGRPTGRSSKTVKPRKGTRGLGGQKMINLPTRLDMHPNFSVTKECSRVASIMSNVPPKHSHEIETLLGNTIHKDFERWMLFLMEGFNIMLYGYGSKGSIFRAFKSYLDDEWLVITINGLYPKTNPKRFLKDFCDALDMDYEEKVRVSSGANIDIIVEEVFQTLKATKHPDVFILVKSIDNIALSHPSLLTVLCYLGQVKWIHIIASSDSINSPLGIHKSQAIQLNLCWISCSSFEPFEEELSWNPSVFGEKSIEGGSKNTLQYVLKSLTGNARKAFSILASLQLSKTQGLSKSKGSKELVDVEFNELARRCRESFLAHSNAALNTLLREFIDHKLISQQGKKNSGTLHIDLDTLTLHDIVNDKI